MPSIRFEPFVGKYAVIKVGVPNPIPTKLVTANKRRINFLGSFVRNDNEWYIYTDRFKDLAFSDIEKVANDLIKLYDDMFPELDNSKFIIRENKLIRRKIFEISQKFYNDVFKVPGTVISPMAGLNSDYTVIGIKYPQSQSHSITELIMDYVKNSRIDISLIQIDMEDKNYPLFLKLMKLLEIELNEYVLIKTIWQMDYENILNENQGVFQNEMIFEPKIFDPNNPGLVGSVINSNGNQKIKGTSPFDIVENFGDNYLVQFDLKSNWFRDFYNDIIHPIGGEFYYWGYSNGKNVVENYYVIRRDNLGIFMNGLRKHWNEKSRANHHNIIESVIGLEKLVP